MENKLPLRASIILPTYNRGEILIDTVNSFARQLSDNDEIVIIDQSDVVPEKVAQHCKSIAKVRYFHITEKGLPNARNVGAKAARGKIIIFSDDDVIPENTFLESHLVPYQDPKIGAVAGRIVEKVERPQLLDNRQKIGTLRKIDGHITRNFEANVSCYVDHFPGGNMSMRRDLLIKINGFDKRFGGTAHLEETDTAARLCAQGFKIIFEPGASLVHLSLGSGGCRELDMSKWLYWYGHNYMLFALKNLPRIYLPIFLAARLAKLFITAIKARSLSQFSQGLNGIRDGWSSSRKTVPNVFGDSQ